MQKDQNNKQSSLSQIQSQIYLLKIFCQAKFKQSSKLDKLLNWQNSPCYIDDLKSKIWRMQEAKYLYQNWNQLFALMVESTADQILLGNNFKKQNLKYRTKSKKQAERNSSILKQIEHIKFTTLKHLSLKTNNINNIQIIAQMNAPQLAELNLYNNKISRINSSLNKTKFIKLRYLNIDRNNICELELSRMKLHQKIDSFLLEWTNSGSFRNSLPIFLILQYRKIQKLDLTQSKHIKQQKIIKMMKENFINQI